MAVFLGELVFRLSINALNITKAVVLTVNDKYKSIPQLAGFIEKLNAAGLQISIENRAIA